MKTPFDFAQGDRQNERSRSLNKIIDNRFIYQNYKSNAS